MTEQNHTTPKSPVTPQVVPQRKPWTVEKKERRLLPLALALAFLAVSLLLDNPAGGDGGCGCQASASQRWPPDGTLCCSSTEGLPEWKNG